MSIGRENKREKEVLYLFFCSSFPFLTEVRECERDKRGGGGEWERLRSRSSYGGSPNGWLEGPTSNVMMVAEKREKEVR